jgi:hypothetical protein
VLLAAALALSPLDAAFAPPARAEEVLSPLEKRRELLRQA